MKPQAVPSELEPAPKLTVDYQAFNEPARPIYAWLWLAIGSLLSVIGLSVYLVKAGLADSDSTAANAIGIAIIIAIVVGVFSACAFLYTYNTAHTRRLKHFAEANGWELVKGDTDDRLPSIFTTQFEYSLARAIIEGDYNQLPFHLVLAENAPDTHTSRDLRNLKDNCFTVSIKFDTSQNFTQLTLLTQHDKLNIENLKFHEVSSRERMGLEGSFDQFFATFVAHGTQREALELLTPDVMQMLMAVPEPASINFGGGELSVFVVASSIKPEVLERLFTTADAVRTALDVV